MRLFILEVNQPNSFCHQRRRLLGNGASSTINAGVILLSTQRGGICVPLEPQELPRLCGS